MAFWWCVYSSATISEIMNKHTHWLSISICKYVVKFVYGMELMCHEAQFVHALNYLWILCRKFIVFIENKDLQQQNENKMTKIRNNLNYPSGATNTRMWTKHPFLPNTTCKHFASNVKFWHILLSIASQYQRSVRQRILSKTSVEQCLLSRTKPTVSNI